MPTLAERHPDIPPFVPDRSRVTPSVTPGWLYVELFNAEGECYALVGKFDPAPPSMSQLIELARCSPSYWMRDRRAHV